jgi:predicted amidohydrolase
LRARAIENQAYVAGVNRVGDGGGIAYRGDSCIIDPFGELLAVAAAGAEQTLVADVDADRVAQVRAQYPFLRDRRTFPVP